jgi:ATP-dependent protease HslVU (ClpYQ) peptidase subunit
MTTIVGIETDGGVVLGGDSQICYSDDMSYVIRSETDKVWRTQTAVLGAAGSVRMSQVFRHYLVVPKLEPDEEIIQDYMVKDFVTAIRHALDDGGHGNGEVDWTMLVGIDRYLYMIDAGMGVHRCQDGHMAIGSGGPYAIASLYTSKMILAAERNIARDVAARVYPCDITPEARLHFALASAERYSSGTEAPFKIVNNYPYLRLLEDDDDND